MKTKFRYFLSGLVVFLTTSALGCSQQQQQTKPIEPSLESVIFNAGNVDTYLLQGEKLDFASFTVELTYSDSTYQSLGIDNCTTNELTYDFGVNEANITYTLEEKSFSYSLDYYVFANESELSFVKEVHNLPYLNKLTLSHVDLVISLLETYESLFETERTFLETYFSNEIDRLLRTESKLISVYHDAKVEELDEYFRTLNQSVYEPLKLTTIQGMIKYFKNSKFSTLKNIVEVYEALIENIKATEKISLSLEEYKTLTITYLQKKFAISFSLVDSSEGQARFISEINNYLEDETFSNEVDAVIASINGAGTADDVDNIFTTQYIELETKLLPILADDFKENILSIFSNLRDIEDDLLSSWNDISISIPGLFDNILCDYLDDNRWWIPEVYKPKVILENTEFELQNAANLDSLINLYTDLVYEITRATLQKNLEMYYAIWRNLNPVYDSGDTYYWNYIADYWGDTSSRQFVYDGPLSEFQGNIYGNTSANCYRLVGFFYSPNYRVTSAEALLEKYFTFKSQIAPPPLEMTTAYVNLDTVKTEYEVNEQIDLTGGTATVVYNDTSKVVIDLDNSMILEEVDTSTLGSKIINLKFVEPKLEQEVQISFSIVVLSNNETYNAIIKAISDLDDATKPNDNHVEVVKNILSLLNSLSESDLATFISTFSIEYEKFLAFEAKIAPYYANSLLSDVHVTFEKLNLDSYAQSDISAITSGYESVIKDVPLLTRFEDIDESIDSFYDLVDSADLNVEVSLDTFKTNTISSLLNSLSYEVNKFSGEATNVYNVYESHSFSENITVSPIYNSILSDISEASSINEVVAIFDENIDELYAATIEAYKIVALENVRQSMYDLRATISMIWTVNDNDIVELKGEGNGVFTTDYLDDGGYYCWYVPVAYQTGNIYRNVEISKTAASKYEIRESYDKALFDMARATMYRNILSTWAHYKQVTSLWTFLYCSPAHVYDGCLEAFEGTVYADSSYRLWAGGYIQNGTRATTIEGLVNTYNRDLAKHYKG